MLSGQSDCVPPHLLRRQPHHPAPAQQRLRGRVEELTQKLPEPTAATQNPARKAAAGHPQPRGRQTEDRAGLKEPGEVGGQGHGQEEQVRV